MAFSQFNDNNFKKGNTINFSNKKHDLKKYYISVCI